LIAAAAVVGVLGLAACGSGGSSSSSQSSSSSGGAATSSTSSSNGIPQGANAGDADADNHGGPSDGDGNI
jgi:hypothetical protein